MFKENNGILMKREDLFVQVPVPFICNPTISDSEKVLYLYFWTYGISDKRGAYPSTQRITADLGWSKPKLLRILKSLEQKGGIYVINRILEGKKEKTSNLYYISEIIDGNFDKKGLEIVKKLYPNKLDTNATKY